MYVGIYVSIYLYNIHSFIPQHVMNGKSETYVLCMRKMGGFLFFVFWEMRSGVEGRGRNKEKRGEKGGREGGVGVSK